MTNEHRYNEMLKAILFGLIGFAILFSIAIYGMEARAAARSAKHQTRIEEINLNSASREATREEEWAEARQELHEYFYEQKMEEAKAEAEEIQDNAISTFQWLEEVIETEAETKAPETMEVTEDDIIEEKVEIEMIETETENEEDNDWFELQPKVEAQPEAQPIPAPSVVTTPVVTTTSIEHKENVNESLQNFLKFNGMTLEDFIIRMTCMVYPEACGESFVGKQGVAEVALNWIYSGLKTDWWDISSGFANIPVQRYYELKYSYNETDRLVIADCEQAVRTVIAGEHPVEDLLGVKPYYFLLPEKSDPINVYIMTQATYQLWVGNQLYLGMEGIDWTQKTN